MSFAVSPLEIELQQLVDQAKRDLGDDVYKSSVLDAYLFGYSFAWIYAKQQLQLNGAAGNRGVNVDLNSFYTNTTPDAISLGSVAPDANVLYANAFLQVEAGSPVVVQLPDVQSELQFVSVQSSNSATQNYQTPYPSETLNNQTSLQSVANPSGGQVLFYWATDDPVQYVGVFSQRIAVNTTVSFLTGRVLVDPSLAGDAATALPSTYSVATIADLNQQFVAADYERFVANGHTMAGLQNDTNTDLTDDVRIAFQTYSGGLNGEFFWQTLALSLNQSYPPAFGIGSESGLQGTPLQFSQQLSAFGITYSEQHGYQFDRSAVTDVDAWLEATRVGFALLTNIETLAADYGSGSWQNVPSTLGDYANSLVGYLMRDVAHIANSPGSAVYPLTYNDSQGVELMGGNTYLMVIRNALASGLPPLAPINVSAMSNLQSEQTVGMPTVMNQGGFWSFTAYDSLLNVTPAINQSVVVAGQNVPVDYTNAVNPALPADTFTNPNTGYAPYTLSSLQLPPKLAQVSGVSALPVVDSVPSAAQFKFEDNGDLVLVLSPFRPVDSRYWNNWLPTPLVTFDSNYETVTDVQSWQAFSPATPQGAAFSLMLRVYNPNVQTSDLAQAVMYQAKLGAGGETLQGQIWNFPAIIESPGASLATDFSAFLASASTDQVTVVTAGETTLFGGFGLNTAIFPGLRSAFTISNDGVTTAVQGVGDQGFVDVSLNNYQQLQFSDATVVLDLVGPPNLALYSLYQTAFDRVADLAGFRYWSEAFASGQADLPDISQDFVLSPEYADSALEDANNALFVDTLYENAFGRDPDAAGFEFWVAALEKGVSRADVMLGFAVSDESWNLVLKDQSIGLMVV